MIVRGCGVQSGWQPGAFFKGRGRFEEHPKYGPQIEVEQIRPVVERDAADGFDEADFAERSRSDTEHTFAELVALAGELADGPLRTLVQTILSAHADRLKGLPASTRYYPFPGGWAEHTRNVARHAVLLADRYAAQYPDLTPPLNRDLVLAGAILHDIGRVREFDPDATVPRSGSTANWCATPCAVPNLDGCARSTVARLAGSSLPL